MRSIVLISILVLTISMSLVSNKMTSQERFHSTAELNWYKSFSLAGDSVYLLGRNSLFTSAGECTGCHGFDLEGVASVDADGNDINVADDWRATMMAMSAKDPFWRAKVSHESLVSPALQDEIESSCTDCHAPMGFYNAMHIGQPHYTMADLKLDSVALDGVSCGACHQISPDSVGKTFSGIDIKYDEDTIYGQYENPFAGPMQSFVGFAPVYSAHIEQSEVCASCHTLITETVALDGTLNGEEFVEQATYHEWLNSTYNGTDELAVECQGCHMTRVDDEVKIAANLLFLPPRSPFFRHDIVGGNTFMLKMMKENRDTLDLRAWGVHFDTIIDRTTRMLQENTLDMVLTELERNEETLTVNVDLMNKAGHKFPSAYPSRIAYVRMLAINEAGDTIFSSGMLDSEYELIDRDFPFEPHYDVITAEDQVQVYELVFGNENGEETTTLSQAQVGLKDNRLVPLGFTTSHSAYDTTLLYGEVLLDDDFNLNALGEEGTGKDLITYQIPIDGESGDIEIQAAVFYQVVPPRWLDEMFAYSSDDIDHFAAMYEEADKEPVMVTSSSLTSGVIGIEELTPADLVVYPNPTRTGEIAVDNQNYKAVTGVRAYSADGKLVYDSGEIRRNTVFLTLPEQAGIYFLKVQSEGQEQMLRVLRL